MEPEPATKQQIEIELLKRIGHGDSQSFEQLYDRFSNILFAIASRFLDDPQAVEEVLQDVFVQIWEKAPLYDPTRCKPLGWAVTLTRHKAIDRLRSIRRRNQLRDEVRREQQNFERFDEWSSFDAVASIDQSKLVRKAIRGLSSAQREVIELAFFSGLTQQQISDRLGEPLGTIKARIRRGMAKLRERIGAQLEL